MKKYLKKKHGFFEEIFSKKNENGNVEKKFRPNFAPRLRLRRRHFRRRQTGLVGPEQRRRLRRRVAAEPDSGVRVGGGRRKARRDCRSHPRRNPRGQ